jgi:hypothetical protein
LFASGAIIYTYVNGNPVNAVDPLGLDVRYENTTAVFGLHQRVSVDIPGGGQYGQSFGRTGDENDGLSEASTAGYPAAGLDGKGLVYPDITDPTTEVQETLKTTPAQDKKIQEWLREQLGNTGPYDPVGNSCRNYSKRTFDIIKKNLADGNFGK